MLFALCCSYFNLHSFNSFLISFGVFFAEFQDKGEMVRCKLCFWDEGPGDFELGFEVNAEKRKEKLRKITKTWEVLKLREI